MRLLAVLSLPALLGACVPETDKEPADSSDGPGPDDSRDPGPDDSDTQDPETTDADGDGVTADQDCDDNNPAVSSTITWYRDVDSDGYAADTGATLTQCDQPTGYAAETGDCDDYDSARNPGATEVCDEDNTDEDCDELSDDDDPSVDASSWVTYYRDEDEDGYGDEERTVTLCEAPAGYVAAAADRSGTDCDDDDAAINPGASEVCDDDDTDEDCDSVADDSDTGTTGTSTWYRDGDEDGYGDTLETEAACDRPTGYVATSGDCDDGDDAVNPDGSEVCDDAGADEDCDGEADDDDGSVSGETTWYRDTDRDTYGTSAASTTACDEPAGYADNASDCDDTDADINPGASEVCDDDDTDEDCDELADDDDSSVSGETTWYRDADSDDYGTSTTSTAACERPSGYVSVSGDCDDSDQDISPAGTEVCDADDDDEDCDGLSDDDDSSVTGRSTYYVDEDGDGYGLSSTTTTGCSLPSGYSTLSTDCDDDDDAINPGVAEDCTTDADDDCSRDSNGLDGEGCADFYADTDGDGHGAGDPACYCEATSTYSTTTADDCDDDDASASPDGTETCGDGTDQDCDGADLSCPSGYVPDGEIALDWITSRAEGSVSYHYAGMYRTRIYDLTGDGYDDMLVSGYGGLSVTGVVYLFQGPLEGAHTLSSTYADATISGAASNDRAYLVNRIGDHDGDGDEDFAVGADGYDYTSGGGAVAVFPGSLTGSVTFSASYPLFYGAAGDGLGVVAPAGDTNDDGYDDMFIAAPVASSSAGRVYLMEGPFAVGARAASTYAVTTFTGETSAVAGTTLIGDVDLNNDGEEDLIIGGYGYGSYAGRVYVYYGPFSSGTVAMGTDTADAVITGEAAGDYLGLVEAVAVVPDMNGDGFDEIAVGAYGEDTAASNAGMAAVFYGPLSGSLSASDADFTVSGVAASDYCGYSVGGVDDIDGDGGGELLVGCPYYDHDSISESGAAFVFYGERSGEHDLLDADLVLYGTTTSDRSGWTVGAAGDFDDDGTPDFYVGAPWDEYTGSSQTGLLYLVPGELDNLLTSSYDGYATTHTYDGYRVSGAGDFNNDGYDDVLVGSQYGNGYVSLILGPWSETSYEAGDATITGDASGDYFSNGLDGGGHINSDAYDDVIVGAQFADSGATNGGEVYILAGRSTPISYTAGTSATANYYGATASESLGYAVSVVQDWDGDGLDDVLASAPGYSGTTGRAFLVTAPRSGDVGTITTYADSSFTAASSYGSFGFSVDGDGDLNNDGYGDVVIGASGWDLPSANAGGAFVYHGGDDDAYSSADADATLTGEAAGDYAGYAVAIVGDVDKDGVDDLVVGAPFTDLNGTSTGTAYLVLGPVSGEIDLADAEYRIDGVEDSDALGSTADGAGDVNGDGYADWLAGAPTASGSYTNSGTTVLVYGPEDGVDSPRLWHGYGSLANAGQVAGAGDTNADGLDDVVIGGYGFNTAWLFLGE